MYEQVEKSNNKNRAVANSVAQKKSNEKQGFGFVDNRSESIAQRKILGMLINAQSPAQDTNLTIQRRLQAKPTSWNPMHDATPFFAKVSNALSSLLTRY
jgi:hypothetical protein